MISENTRNQIRFTAKNNIKDKFYGTKLSNSKYWDKCDEITIEQSEFNSLNLSQMHYKDERLTKNNPYIFRKAKYRNHKVVGFQQLYHESIKYKIIAEPDIIQDIKEAKYWEENKNYKDELDEIRNYNKKYRIKNTYRIEEYIINLEERLEELHKRVQATEELMDEIDKLWFEENIDDVELPSNLYDKVKMVSEEYGLTYDEVWYVYNKKQIPKIKDKITELEKRIYESEHY